MIDKVNALYERLKLNTNLEGSAGQLVSELADMFGAIATDPIGIKTLAADLKGSAQLLGAAVLEQTHPHPTPPPAAPAPAPHPAPPPVHEAPVHETLHHEEPEHPHGRGHAKHK